jgi:hypothetical protein
VRTRPCPEVCSALFNYQHELRAVYSTMIGTDFKVRLLLAACMLACYLLGCLVAELLICLVAWSVKDIDGAFPAIVSLAGSRRAGDPWAQNGECHFKIFCLKLTKVALLRWSQC